MIRVPKSKARLRKESRTIPVWGSDERGDGLDYKRWYRCWNCGFLNSIDRNALGDSQSFDGLDFQEFTSANYETEHGEARLGDSLVAQENDSTGSPKSVHYSLQPVTNSGCTLCGTLNWRGDY